MGAQGIVSFRERHPPLDQPILRNNMSIVEVRPLDKGK